MTPTRYFFARIALTFGISRKQRRMAEAATETHLLREAEQILGQRIWQRVESVEELGIEYWNLRRLHKKRDELKQKLADAEQTLQDAHEQRAELLGVKSEAAERLENQRAKVLDELEQLVKQRDDVVRRARDVRRIYEGIKAKLEVLRTEGRTEPDAEASSHTRMRELRGQFDGLKGERSEVAAEISRYTERVSEFDRKLEEERKKHRTEAAEAFQTIGEANQKISALKAELGLIETEMWQLYGEIGRHVSRSTKTSPTCREATREWAAMVAVMGALRRSINLNHRLAGS